MAKYYAKVKYFGEDGCGETYVTESYVYDSRGYNYAIFDTPEEARNAAEPLRQRSDGDCVEAQKIYQSD